MKNKIRFNISLKIISVFFAFLLWMVVNNMNNPTVDKTFRDIPVKLLNTELITDSGQVYEVLDDTDVIDTVTIWAPRSIISSLNASNIVATADVSELSSLDTISIKLSTNLYTNDVESIKGSSDTVKLNIENKRTKTLALKTTLLGAVENGYLVGEVTTEQNLVRISGPDSIVSQITKATVEVDVAGFTSDIGTNAEIRLYDADDNLIQDSRVTQNIKSVGVKINIYETAEVPVHFSVTGTPQAGYREYGEIESSIESVTLAGKSSVLRNINSIEIPAEAIDISGQSEDYTTEVDIRNYLPENTYLADSAQAKVTVTIHIQQEISRKLEISGEKVRVTNIPEGFRASISELGESFTIEVIGLSSDVLALRAGDIEGIVDITAWMAEEEMTEPVEGYYQVEVDFGLPDNIRMAEPVMVTMHLSKMEE